MNCGNEMKMKKWSSQWTQFMKLRKEKNSGLQRGLNPWPFEPDTSQFMQLRKEAWKKIRSRVHTKLKSWRFFRLLLRNCINCIHCDDHFFIFISFPQFIYDLFHISLAKQGQMDNGNVDVDEVVACTEVMLQGSRFKFISHYSSWCSIRISRLTNDEK